MGNANRCKWIGTSAIVLGILLVGVSGASFKIEMIRPLFFLGTAVALGGWAFLATGVRCPHCRHSLGLYVADGGCYCPYCGQELTE